MREKVCRGAILAAAVILVMHAMAAAVAAAPQEKLDSRARCAVCGMFVAKYPNWNCQIHHNDGTVLVFDGVKDLMAYYFNPTDYGKYDRESITEIWVKDYYTLEWLEGRRAFYVIGSDTYGPMGNELIPFSSREAARTFLKDHHGKKVLAFDEITADQVEELRSGQMMKMK